MQKYKKYFEKQFFYPLVFRKRVVGGQSPKMALPFLGSGLAMWCKHSEHCKSQLPKKIFSPLIIICP